MKYVTLTLEEGASNIVYVPAWFAHLNFIGWKFEDFK